MAPEYAMRGYLTDKADVYSFGIVALEIVSGKSNNMGWQREECFSLFDWALLLKEKGDLMDLVDERLGSHYKKDEATLVINVALLCTNTSPLNRPTMSSVVSMLEGKTAVQEVVPDTTQVFGEKKLEMIRDYYQQKGKDKIPDTEDVSTSTNETAVFVANSEDNSINMDSSYWERSGR
ncbi:hypothetical protein HN873_024382 [Arachis hypogaea]